MACSSTAGNHLRRLNSDDSNRSAMPPRSGSRTRSSPDRALSGRASRDQRTSSRRANDLGSRNESVKGFSRATLRFLEWSRLILLLASITLSAVLLCGATTASLADSHVLSLSPQDNASVKVSMKAHDTLSYVYHNSRGDSDILEVRVGYLGACAQVPSGTWICERRPSDLVNKVRAANSTDPMNLIWVSEQFRNESMSLIFLFITLAAGAFGSIFALRHVSNLFEPLFLCLPSSYLGFVSGLVSVIATFAALITALWQHLASGTFASMASVVTADGVECHVGPRALAFAWATFALSGISLICAIFGPAHTGPWRELGVGGLESTANMSTENEAEQRDNVEMAEEPELPQPIPPPEPQMTNLAFLLYLTGQMQPERTTRHRNAAAWVRNPQHMHHGFAVTELDEE